MTATHPAPAEVQARWRASGAWTDETLLDRLARVDGSQLAIVDWDQRLTIDDVREQSAAVAAGLRQLNVLPGTVVAMQLPNWWEAVVLCWAAWRCGAIVAPITPTLRAREVGFILRQSNARVAIVPHEFRGTDYPELVRSTGFAGGVLEVRGRYALPMAAAAGYGVDATPDDRAVILWTSGTTSDPKGVVHTHQSLRAEADTIAAAHEMQRGEPLLLPMPVTHVAGLTYGALLPVTSGITAVLMDTWEPGRALELLEREHIAVMISTPVFMRTMIDHPRFTDTDTSTLRLFSLGGAGVAPAMVREGAAAFDCWCKRTYGSTEYPTLTTGLLGDDPERDATTDGRLIAEAELRIVDPQTGADVAPGELGELLARGPEMFVGYLDAGLDAESFLPGGWFRTGDLARYDGEYLTIVDRLKDVIIRGGENISAQEVEALLVTHPSVAEAACVSTPDPVMGEEVCAFVIPAGKASPVLDELRTHLLEHGLARFKLPTRLEVRSDLPRTASGKVQKAPLRDEIRGERVNDADFRTWVVAELSARLAPRRAGDTVSVLGAGNDDLEAGRRYLDALSGSGLAVPSWPRECGGLRATPEQVAIIRRELAAFAVPDLYPYLVAVELVGPTLLAHGSPEQCTRWLPPITTGAEIWCQLFSEPGAGSDLAGLSTRARAHGDEWRVTGQKVWTSRGAYSRYGLLLARHDSGVPKHQGITAFGIDLRTPGVEVRPLRQMNGDAHFTEVFLDDAVVPDTDRIGAIGEGWRVALTCLSFERGAVAAGGSSGMLDVDRLITLARARGVDTDPSVRDALARLVVEQRVMALTARRARDTARSGRPGPEGSGMKLRGSRTFRDYTNLALRLLGPDALTVAEPWHTLFLTAPSLSIRGGTDEIQRNIIGERILGLAEEPRLDRTLPFDQLPH